MSIDWNFPSNNFGTVSGIGGSRNRNVQRLALSLPRKGDMPELA